MKRLPDDIQEIPRLLGDAVEQLGKLAQNELRLAKAELSEKVTQASIGAAYLAAAAVLVIPVLVLLLMALALLLIQMGFSPVSSHVIAAAVGGVVCGMLAWIGLARLKPEKLAPTVTLQQVQRDVTTAKELAR